MELLHYWRVIRKSLWLIALIAILSVVVMTAYTVTRPKVYQSTTLLLLNTSVSSQYAPLITSQIATNLADSYTQLMSTYSFGQEVVAKLPYASTPEHVISSIDTTLQANTLFYSISAKENDPVKAQQLVSTVVDVFLAANASQQNTASGGAKATARKNMQDTLDSYTKEYQTAQQKLSLLQSQQASDGVNAQIAQVQSQITYLLQNINNTNASLANLGDTSANITSAQIIDDARIGVAVPSSLSRNILIALLAALVIGTGLAFIRSNLDYTIHSPDELRQIIGVSPMSVFGVLDNGSKGRSYGYGYSSQANSAKVNLPDQLRNKNLITLERMHAPESESFRTLRTNIQFSNLDSQVRSLVVTSVNPGEGKSFTSSNLAVVMAQAGKRVILVDTDLRRPSVHKVFGLANNFGFTNMLMQDDEQLDFMQKVESIDNLVVIPSGPLPPNPSELLNSRRASELIERLMSYCDMLILDAPPAGAVTDPVIMAAQVDAVVLVIRAGSTRIDAIERVMQTLQSVGVNSILPVLNRVRTGDLSSYSYRYYYGGDSQSGTTTDSDSSSGAGSSGGSGRRDAIPAGAASQVTPFADNRTKA